MLPSKGLVGSQDKVLKQNTLMWHYNIKIDHIKHRTER